jgi:hypothetical protein
MFRGFGESESRKPGQHESFIMQGQGPFSGGKKDYFKKTKFIAVQASDNLNIRNREELLYPDSTKRERSKRILFS